MKTRYIIPIVILIAVLALAALSTPAMAASCKPAVSTSGSGSYGTNGTINGTVHVEDAGPTADLGNTKYRKDFTVPSGNDIKWARVYWHIWGGNPQGDGWTNATFCNATQCWTNNQSIPQIDDPNYPNNCQNDETDGYYMGGSGTHWVYWNVTDYTSVGANNLTVDNSNGDWDGRTMWMTMVAVLENNTKYTEMHYWINQGYEDLAQGSTSTTWFNGPINNETNSTLWHHALASNDPMRILFNGHEVHDYNSGSWNLVEEEIDKGWIEVDDSTQNMTWDNDGDPWLHPVVAILVDTRVGTDLRVEDIDVRTPRPDNDSTVKATVKNWGKDDAGHFNVSLYIDNVLNGTVNVTAGLGAGASTTVSFTKVNESKGCYDFKVIVDVDGVIDEANEDNNATTVKGQVGYVIKVNSYHDFDDLVTESNDGLLGAGNVSHSGDTYYIKNFTGSSAIENCACNGITIKNLNATTNFEITNCTIENCVHSGVKFHNLTSGTINGSDILNNTLYGIEVGVLPLDSNDPDDINITNNTIDDNKYGVYLVGFNATVSNNTITNSSGSGYGIYLLANDTNITYNVIQNNTDYGVKLYNSSDNYVYGNDFICNNVDYPARVSQGCDENGNDNDWNTSTVGNYWTDWDDNTPTDPGNYSIDCDSNKDYKPRGLCVCSCNMWAFRDQLTQAEFNSGSPVYPGTEFTDAEYARIAKDDETRQEDQTDADGKYAAHRFNCSINSSLTSGIDKINATWIGKGDHDSLTDGAKLYIFNFSATPASCYEELDSDPTGPPAEITLTGGVTNDTCNNIFTDYINGNNVTILVNQTSAHVGGEEPAISRIWTDYIKLVITPE